MNNLYEKICALYPELNITDFIPGTGSISLQNDSDGRGDYIAKWEHPIYPRPTDEQLLPPDDQTGQNTPIQE
jgi:hypothetical protein